MKPSQHKICTQYHVRTNFSKRLRKAHYFARWTRNRVYWQMKSDKVDHDETEFFSQVGHRQFFVTPFVSQNARVILNYIIDISSSLITCAISSSLPRGYFQFIQMPWATHKSCSKLKCVFQNLVETAELKRSCYYTKHFLHFLQNGVPTKCLYITFHVLKAICILCKPEAHPNTNTSEEYVACAPMRSSEIFTNTIPVKQEVL